MGLNRVNHVYGTRKLHIINSDSPEQPYVKKALGEYGKGFESFLVRKKDGDYDEVWGAHGDIIWGREQIWRII